jgi:hypothetical protein
MIPLAGTVRVAAAVFAAVAFAVPLATATIRPIAVIASLGLSLAALGIAGLWRWPATAAACVFLVDYAIALWLAGAPVSIGAPVVLGLALVLLVRCVDLGRRLRHASVDARVLRAQALTWLAFGTATVTAIALGVALAGAGAASIPYAAAPFVAAAAAFGVIVTLAAAVTGAGRRRS